MNKIYKQFDKINVVLCLHQNFHLHHWHSIDQEFLFVFGFNEYQQ